MSIEDPFTEILDGLDDKFVWTTFDNKSAIGLHLQWSEKSHGFGELYLLYRKETKKFVADTEHMDQQTVARLIAKSAWQLAGLLLELDKPE